MLERIQNNKNSNSLLVELQNGQPLWKTGWQILAKLKIVLPYNPALVLLSIYPTDLKLKSTQNLLINVYSNFIHNPQD